MTNYSIDIERLNEAIQQRGGVLRGIACLQYPIYCIHADIIDTTPDPFGNIERLISEFYFEKPDFTVPQIASLIGTPRSFVDQRILSLLTDGLLEKNGAGYSLTASGSRVFRDAIQEREYNRSFDFFIDGINFQPLPRVFYTNYRSKLISETDLHFYTNKRGETKSIIPFGPDIVHTPLNKVHVMHELQNIEHADRNDFSIPIGMKDIRDITFTRQTFPLLISIATYKNKIEKDLIDGFAFVSDADYGAYYEAVKRYVSGFETILKERLKKLEFRTERRQSRPHEIEINVTTNWNEIDRSSPKENRCYSFSAEDMIAVIADHFKIRGVKMQDIINDDTEIKIKVTRQTLRTTPDKQKLVRSIIRGRDYRLFKNSKYVWLLYLMFVTEDPFIKEILRLKHQLKNLSNHSAAQIKSVIEADEYFSKHYRELLCEAGELDLLEKVDIELYMHKLN